ncbi:MAG: hypothetical protein EXR28_08225 [Betaproteobacteria bacterium]|nr:hypothetical protein [Betaproteobacteria bacterium]
MNSISSSASLPPIRSAALARALSDPKVEGLARSLNLNLRDPATLNNLLARARHSIESSTHVTLGAEPVATDLSPATDLVPIQSPYVRHALQTYLRIGAMT